MKDPERLAASLTRSAPNGLAARGERTFDPAARS
jgi:hypothetical protein